MCSSGKNKRQDNTMGNVLSSHPNILSCKKTFTELLATLMESLAGLGRIEVNQQGIPPSLSETTVPPRPPSPKEEPPEVRIEKARTEFGLTTEGGLHIAVVGGSGVGKSSFVNGIRLMRDTEEGAAPIGESHYTTSIQQYPHPLLHRIVLWDFPGAESFAHPAATYFNDMKLYAFDFIVILSSDRFLKVDFDIAKLAREYKKPVVFVRTKADVAIKSIVERTGVTALEASTSLRESVEASFQEGLQYSGLSSTNSSSAQQAFPLFIVSKKAFTDMSAYHIVDATGQVDDSLVELDEHKIYAFMADTAKPKLMPSKTFRGDKVVPHTNVPT